jgi:hypothetical protein
MANGHIFQGDLRLIYEALGGDSSAVPPVDITDTLNWWLSQINEMISGELIPKAPDDVFDDTNWWLRAIYAGLSGDVVNPPGTVRDSLQWWFQQFHEFYTEEGGVVPPDPCPELDVLDWWLDLLYEDILNGGSVPWRFRLSLGELGLSGDSLPPSFALNPVTGELTVDDSDLPAGFTNWRVQNGRLFADEVT